jgi:hypothetical protein
MAVSAAIAQGPAPETAPPLFPGGGLVSYSSALATRSVMPGQQAGQISVTGRPTLSHEADFNFTWGFYRNFDLTVLVPIVTNHFDAPAAPVVHGTGLGDTTLLVKYRFYRRDSSRGTTQVSFTVGPKLPTGRADLTSTDGRRAPAGLQPGSGSTDLFLGANGTYTGLFNFKRLVADEDFHVLVRSEGVQATRLGSDFTSRFWISYRPYEVTDGSREWFIGPVLTWLRSLNDRVAGAIAPGSGGDVFLAGITTYVGVRPGMHLWLGLDWDAAHSSDLSFMPARRHVSFGITQQFRMHLFR